MTAPIHDPSHAPSEDCAACDLAADEATRLWDGDVYRAPDPAATAEQTVADLLALCAVFEQKPIAYQWIRPSVIRSIIESGGAE